MSAELGFLLITLGKDLLIDIGTSIVINTATGAVAGSVLPGAGNAAGAGLGAVRGVIVGVIKVSRSKKYYTTAKKIYKIVEDKKKAQSLIKVKKNNLKKDFNKKEKIHNEVGAEEKKIDAKSLQENIPQRNGEKFDSDKWLNLGESPKSAENFGDMKNIPTLDNGSQIKYEEIRKVNDYFRKSTNTGKMFNFNPWK